MKKIDFAAIVVAAALCAGTALAQVNEYNFTFTNGFNNGGIVPDANANGLALSTNLTGLSGSISNLTLSLNINGGYNGDLYAYLAGPNGGFVVLLNRPGVTNGVPFGYNNGGFNVTFSDSAANNFHYYQTVPGYDLSSGTTIWQPDGRNINPQSDPGVLGAFTTNSFLSSFDNSSPDGTWTLFLADLSGGGQSTVVSWNLDITTVPEPSSFVLTGIAFAALLNFHRRKF